MLIYRYKAQIYLSQADTFNDPFDCRANFNYHKAIKSGGLRKALFEQFPLDDFEKIPEKVIQKSVVEGMRKSVYVFCFSEIWDSLLMWAHYANNYNGYCIEYDMSKVRNFITYNLWLFKGDGG